jgi:hypothetical protein
MPNFCISLMSNNRPLPTRTRHKPSWNDLLSFAVVFYCQITSGRGFVNLGFEETTLTPVGFDSFSGLYDYIATVPGWTWTPQFNFAGVNGHTMVSLNDASLDAPAVTLQGTTAINGNYSILLQGGGLSSPPSSFSAIWQTGRIPSTAESITYWGGSTSGYLQRTFTFLQRYQGSAKLYIWGCRYLGCRHFSLCRTVRPAKIYGSLADCSLC